MINLLIILTSDYYKLFACFKDRALKNRNCNETQVQTFNNFTKELFGGVIDLLCTDYAEGSKKCNDLGNLIISLISLLIFINDC